MATVTAKKRINDEDKSATVEYDFGADMDGAVKLMGKDVVYAQYLAQATVRLQAIMRTALEAGKDQKEITAIVAGWKPGTKISIAKDPKAAFMAAFGKMTPAEKKAAIASLQAA